MRNSLNLEVKSIIENKQNKLNNILRNEKADKNEVLKLSVELDKLIFKYYSLNQRKKSMS